MGTLSKSFENKSLSERFKSKQAVLGKDTCLLLDTSSSMHIDCEPGKSRIEALRDIVKGIVGNIPMYSFDSQTEKVTKDNIPEPRGSTFVATALRRIKADGFTSAIMITDGEASDPDAALKEVQGFKLQVMYVGSGPRPDFLDKLANAGGGFCTTQDLSQPKELTEKLQLLLGPGDGKSEDNKSEVIEL